MPPEREKIEAELRVSERERVVAKCRRLINQFDEFERRLQALEAERGVPPSYRSKPLVKRMAHLGMSGDALDQIKQLLAAIKVFAEADDPPVKGLLAEHADAEYSAVDQLAVLMESRREESERSAPPGTLHALLRLMLLKCRSRLAG
jgi:primosomal protein N''